MNPRPLALSLLLAALTLPRAARAQWLRRVALRPSVGATMMLSEHQRQRLDFGLGLSSALTLTVDATRVVGGYARVAHLWFPSGQGDGEALLTALGPRVWATLGDAGRPWAELGVGVALTGGAARFAFDAAVGWDFSVSPAVSVGPVVRYTQLVAGERDAPSDAQALSLGAQVSFQAPGAQGVVIATTRADRDGDGVDDARDVCPELSAGALPDPTRPGCPLNDRDHDRVFDRDDDCPNVAAGPHPDPARPGCPLPAPTAVPPPAVSPPAPSPSPRPRPLAWRATLAEPVRFALSEGALDPDGRAVVAQMALALAAAPEGVRLVVEGHADPGSEREHAASLGTRRAQAVIDALVEHGVSRTRMVSRTAGSTRPLWSPRTEEGRRGNRRVELRVVGGE